MWMQRSGEPGPNISHIGTISTTSLALAARRHIQETLCLPQGLHSAVARFHLHLDEQARDDDRGWAPRPLGILDAALQHVCSEAAAFALERAPTVNPELAGRLRDRQNGLLLLAIGGTRRRKANVATTPDMLALVCKVALIIGSPDLFYLSYKAGGDVGVESLASRGTLLKLAAQLTTKSKQRLGIELPNQGLDGGNAIVPSLWQMSFRATRRALATGGTGTALTSLLELQSGAAPAWCVKALSFGLLGNDDAMKQGQWVPQSPASTDYFRELSNACLMDLHDVFHELF